MQINDDLVSIDDKLDKYKVFQTEFLTAAECPMF